MPISTPRTEEDKETFINRCMSDGVMNREFPSNEQRFAVCNQKWRDKGKKEKQAENESEQE